MKKGMLKLDWKFQLSAAMLLICSEVLVSCGWSRKDKVLALAYVGVNVADYWLTENALDAGCIEQNPILGPRPTDFVMGVSKAFSTLIPLGLAHLAGPKYRPWMLGSATFLIGGAVFHNTRVECR